MVSEFEAKVGVEAAVTARHVIAILTWQSLGASLERARSSTRMPSMAQTLGALACSELVSRGLGCSCLLVGVDSFNTRG